MYKTSFNGLFVFLILLLCSQLVGCTHERSYFHKNEVVDVQMIKKQDLCQGQYSSVLPDYRHAFNGNSPCQAREKALPAIAVTVVGIAADQLLKFGAGKLKEEAAKHGADFAGETLITDFWDGDELKYPVIRIVRSASNDDEDKKEDRAYELFLGLLIDPTNDFIWIKPIRFVTNAAKPKVGKSKGEIVTRTDISFDSAWLDKKGVFHKQNLATFTPVSINGYSLKDVKVINTYSDDLKKAGSFNKNNTIVGIMPPVQVTKSVVDAPSGHGLLWVKAVVTEVDKSKAKALFQNLGDGLDKGNDKIVDALKKQLGE